MLRQHLPQPRPHLSAWNLDSLSLPQSSQELQPGDARPNPGAGTLATDPCPGLSPTRPQRCRGRQHLQPHLHSGSNSSILYRVAWYTYCALRVVLGFLHFSLSPSVAPGFGFLRVLLQRDPCYPTLAKRPSRAPTALETKPWTPAPASTNHSLPSPVLQG